MSTTITHIAETELIAQIEQHHELAERRQMDAIDGINDLVEARLSTAALVETAKANLGHRFHQWWREYGLPTDWDHKYIRIAKTRDNLQLNDRNQLRLIGILPDIEHDGDGDNQGTVRPINPFAWVKIAGKLKATLTEDTVKAMDAHERQTARLHLKPLVELYNALDE